MRRPAPPLLGLVLLGFALSVMTGKLWVPPQAFFSDDPLWRVIVDLRLPRTFLGLGVGATLGLSGAVLQGYLRNPLADPAVIGVSSWAAFGAVAALFLGIGGNVWLLAGCAMLAACLSVLLLSFLVGRSASAVGFILTGAVLSTLAGSLTTLLISLAPNPYAMGEIITWMMGALTDRSYEELAFSAPFMLAGAALLLTTAPALDALSLGEDVARSLGFSLTRLQIVIAVGLGLGVGAAVAVTGVVGFVGLMVPHVLRPLVGQKPSALLIPSALGGAFLVLTADSLVRLTPGAGEVKLGVATSLIGAPFFFWLLWRTRRHLA